MDKLEYIKIFWKYIDKETPILLFYEVDLENERYATRMTEVFYDRTIKPYVEEGFAFVTEAPVPTVEEINQEPEFFAVNVSKEEFEKVYTEKEYWGSVEFPSI